MARMRARWQAERAAARERPVELLVRAEEHAALFACGLSTRGLKPFLTIYSTFMQRAFDMIVHDMALQNLPVRLCMDRGGLSGDDGPTHHGLFDIAYLRGVPGIVHMQPRNEDEFVDMLWTMANYDKGPIAIRYPRGNGPGVTPKDKPMLLEIGKAEVVADGSDVALIALGDMFPVAEEAKKQLEAKGLSVALINPRWIKPLDGACIEQGEIAGPIVAGHNNFQDAQAFLSAGGRRGLQEQILLSGQWNLNPWFAHVEQVEMVEIPIGHVGVVISYVGNLHEDVSGPDFKHGDLVEVGHKGVWVRPLLPGKHPLNLRVMRVELVPTTNIVLNWANRTEAHQFDEKLNSITVRSRDGFAFNLDVSQIIHIGANEAPKVISRAGSVQNLIDHALQPIVGNYFRNSAQAYTVLDFLSARTERQYEAANHIAAALREYDVEAIDTLIGDITPPESLMKTQTDRKIAEEHRKTYEMQEAAEKQHQQLVRQTSLADIQNQVVSAEEGVRISELHASAAVKKSEGDATSTRLRAAGEADAIRSTGQAKAEAHYAGIQAVGQDTYALMQLFQIIAEKNLRVVPDVLVNGGGANGGLVEALMALVTKNTRQASLGS